MKRQVGRWIVGLVTAAFVGLCLWTAYANVFSDDAAVRTRGEKVARDKAGCGDTCRLVRVEGERGILKETLAYTFVNVGQVDVTCRRPYIAFGEYACEASVTPRP
jgi:hypothetical protein